MIEELKGEYRFLSNFWPAPVMFEGRVYPTVEHAYQAAKTTDKREKIAIQQCGNAGMAKRLGAELLLQPDWELRKQEIMRQLLYAKFEDLNLRQLLLATEDREIKEGNTWHDVYWGICNCEKCRGEGQNILGKMLMNIRAECRVAVSLTS